MRSWQPASTSSAVASCACKAHLAALLIGLDLPFAGAYTARPSMSQDNSMASHCSPCHQSLCYAPRVLHNHFRHTTTRAEHINSLGSFFFCQDLFNMQLSGKYQNKKQAPAVLMQHAVGASCAIRTCSVSRRQRPPRLFITSANVLSISVMALRHEHRAPGLSPCVVS